VGLDKARHDDLARGIDNVGVVCREVLPNGHDVVALKQDIPMLDQPKRACAKAWVHGDNQGSFADERLLRAMVIVVIMMIVVGY
jgi:hypothetical protein